MHKSRDEAADSNRPMAQAAGTARSSPVNGPLRSSGPTLLTALVLVPFVAGADTQRAQLLVSAYVAPRTEVAAVTAPASVDLTATDLRQGYKDVAAVYTVSNNVARGYVVRFAARSGLTRSMEVRGLGVPIEVGASGADLARLNRPVGADELQVTYRFYLAPAAREGRYPLPVSVSAAPL